MFSARQAARAAGGQTSKIKIAGSSHAAAPAEDKENVSQRQQQQGPQESKKQVRKCSNVSTASSSSSTSQTTLSPWSHSSWKPGESITIQHNNKQSAPTGSRLDQARENGQQLRKKQKSNDALTRAVIRPDSSSPEMAQSSLSHYLVPSQKGKQVAREEINGTVSRHPLPTSSSPLPSPPVYHIINDEPSFISIA